MIKQTILITHYDRGINPEIVNIKGKNNTDLILDFYRKCDKLMFILGEDDEFLNSVGEDSEEEVIKNLPHPKLEDLVDFINYESDYTATYMEVNND